MRILFLVAILASLAAGQTKLPPDVDKDSLSRLPILKRSDMKDDDERRIFDAVYGDRKTPLLGPGGISLYSPHVAESMHIFNEHLRFQNVVGRPLTEVAILVAAREVDQAYEWNSHENTARMIGVDPRVIEVIKNGIDASALPEKERTIIEFGRATFRNHFIGAPLYDKTVKLFGNQGMYEITALMGDYLFAGILLHAADQHPLPDAKYPLPARKIPEPAKIAAKAPPPNPLPAGYNKDWMSRIPTIDRASLDEPSQKIFDMVRRGSTQPMAGPTGVSLYSVPVAQGMHLLNTYLGGANGPGARYFQLASLVGSREFDQQYEWTSHEPGALRAGVPQATIDVIKFNKPIAGIDNEKDEVVIRVGRQLFEEHKLDSSLWAKMVAHFGNRGTIDIIASMADYAMVGLMLNAVDQQLPENRPPLMPLRQ